MGQKPSYPTRRNILEGVAACSAFCAAGSQLAAKSLNGLHDYAAQSAKSLSGGRDLTLRILIPNGSGANVRPAIAAFKAATGISVLATETPVDEINVELTLDALSGAGDYDLALPATFGLPDLVSTKAIIPLSEYARKHEPDSFRSGILYQTGDSFDGNLYGFQTDGDAYVMFYHQDLLEDQREQDAFSDRFGYALKAPQTWTELDQQIEFFHRPAEGLSGGLLFRTPSYVAWEWWVRFHAKGLWPFSVDLEPQIASKEGVQALEELIHVTRFLPPETATLGLFENWERFGKGNVYCNIGWGGTQKYLNSEKSQMKGRMIYGPTPGGMVDGSLLLTPYFNWGWNYVVTSQTTHPEIAYLFALFASSSEISTQSVRQPTGYFDPFRPEHYEDRVVRNTYSDAFLKVHAQSMRNAIPDLYLAHQGEYFRVLSEWLSRALRMEISPQDALSRVSEHWKLISVRTGLRRQKERWLQLRNKYPADVRNRLHDLT
jgi:multiple sugar transport system substrate-binding protein